MTNNESGNNCIFVEFNLSRNFGGGGGGSVGASLIEAPKGARAQEF